MTRSAADSLNFRRRRTLIAVVAVASILLFECSTRKETLRSCEYSNASKTSSLRPICRCRHHARRSAVSRYARHPHAALARLHQGKARRHRRGGDRFVYADPELRAPGERSLAESARGRSRGDGSGVEARRVGCARAERPGCMRPGAASTRSARMPAGFRLVPVRHQRQPGRRLRCARCRRSRAARRAARLPDVGVPAGARAASGPSTPTMRRSSREGSAQPPCPHRPIPPDLRRQAPDRSIASASPARARCKLDS